MRLQPPPRKRQVRRRRGPGRPRADPRCWAGPFPGPRCGRPRRRRRASRPRHRPPRPRVRAEPSRPIRPAPERAWRSAHRRSPKRPDPAEDRCRPLPRAAGRTPRAPPAAPVRSGGPIRGPPQPDRRARPRRPRRRQGRPCPVRPRPRACATGLDRSRSPPPRPALLRESPRGRTGHRRRQRQPADPRSIGSARGLKLTGERTCEGAHPVRKGISSLRSGLEGFVGSR